MLTELKSASNFSSNLIIYIVLVVPSPEIFLPEAACAVIYNILFEATSILQFPNIAVTGVDSLLLSVNLTLPLLIELKSASKSSCRLVIFIVPVPLIEIFLPEAAAALINIVAPSLTSVLNNPRLPLNAVPSLLVLKHIILFSKLEPLDSIRLKSALESFSK